MPRHADHPYPRNLPWFPATVMIDNMGPRQAAMTIWQQSAGDADHPTAVICRRTRDLLCICAQERPYENGANSSNVNICTSRKRET